VLALSRFEIKATSGEIECEIEISWFNYVEHLTSQLVNSLSIRASWKQTIVLSEADRARDFNWIFLSATVGSDENGEEIVSKT
jgi:hypothetical protein